ncbi:hypothetical protein D3C86_1995080 [compost metagenome]
MMVASSSTPRERSPVSGGVRAITVSQSATGWSGSFPSAHSGNRTTGIPSGIPARMAPQSSESSLPRNSALASECSRTWRTDAPVSEG